MRTAKTFAAILLTLGSIALLACSPSGSPKTADDKASDDKPIDTSHLGEPAPVKNQDAPDIDFLIDMAGRSGRQALKCDTPEIKGPRDVATVEVTFEPTGWSGEIAVSKPHDGTPIGECIHRAFERVPVTNFKGSPVTLEQKIDFGKKAIEKATPRGGAAPPPPPTSEDKEKKGGSFY
jgi:hypothetical protein